MRDDVGDKRIDDLVDTFGLQLDKITRNIPYESGHGIPLRDLPHRVAKSTLPARPRGTSPVAAPPRVGSAVSRVTPAKH
jgi:hypothetical protein